MNEINYGMSESTEALDTNGSFVKHTKKYIDHLPVYPQESYYEIRERVTSSLEEALSIASITKELRENKDIIEAGYRIEGYQVKDKKGHYYIVKCFRRKVFENS